MSSTKALKEITIKHGGEYFPSAVGEVNVVKKMKEVNAVIGGEGNGGGEVGRRSRRGRRYPAAFPRIRGGRVPAGAAA